MKAAYFSNDPRAFDSQFTPDIDPNLEDQGEPVLQIAIRYGRTHIVKRLLEGGANPNRKGTRG